MNVPVYGLTDLLHLRQKNLQHQQKIYFPGVEEFLSELLVPSEKMSLKSHLLHALHILLTPQKKKKRGKVSSNV